MNLCDALCGAARHWLDRPAFIDEAGVRDYRFLWGEVGRVRTQLCQLGVREGQGVGVWARNGWAFAVGALAAVGCGAVVMPIHHRIKPDELTQMLACAPLSILLDDGCRAIPAGETTGGLELSGGGGLRFTRLNGAGQPVAPGFEDAAFVRFTSGTTGTAKGVVLTHGGVLDRIRAANTGLGLTCRDRVLWVLPMAYHFYVSILLYLHAGAAIVLGRDCLAESLLDRAWRHQATFLYVTPMHVGLLAGEGSGRALPPSLTRVMSVSSRLEPRLAGEFLARYAVPVAQGYGIIEVGLPIMNLEEALEHPEAIGRPLKAFEAVVAGEGFAPKPQGQTGQLALRGPGMFAGYLSPPRRRAEVLPEGWFLTGDLAHRDTGGRIVLDGRASSVIHVAGHKVFPEEVAAVLDRHPAVLRSRVTKRPHPELGEAVHAEVQLRNRGPAAGAEDILEFCRRRLSDHKVPATLGFVSRIELTPSGKVRHG